MYLLLSIYSCMGSIGMCCISLMMLITNVVIFMYIRHILLFWTPTQALSNNLYFLFPYRIFSLCILYVAEVVVVIPLAFLCRLSIFFIRHHRIMRTMRCDVSLFRTTDQPFKDDAHAFTQIILHLFLINIYCIIAIFYYIFLPRFIKSKLRILGEKNGSSQYVTIELFWGTRARIFPIQLSQTTAAICKLLARPYKN